MFPSAISLTLEVFTGVSKWWQFRFDRYEDWASSWLIFYNCYCFFCFAGEKLVTSTRADHMDTPKGSGFSCTCSKLDQLAAPNEVLFQTFG